MTSITLETQITYQGEEGEMETWEQRDRGGHPSGSATSPRQAGCREAGNHGSTPKEGVHSMGSKDK